MNDKKEQALRIIHQELAKLSAADAAELFLSPYVSAELLIKATEESGPSMWIINRSDVYDESLEAMTKHSIPGMAERAAQKIKLRKAKITSLTPPEITKPLKELDKYEAEDFLGHPLCPFEIMLYFTLSPDEDVRGSSALSLTRRLLEFPPDWTINLSAREEIKECFYELMSQDLSPFVRSYCARIPLFTEKEISACLENERNEHVLSKLIQNHSATVEQIISIKDQFKNSAKIQSIAALDSRIPSEKRSLQNTEDSTLSDALHTWHLP